MHPFGDFTRKPPPFFIAKAIFPSPDAKKGDKGLARIPAYVRIVRTMEEDRVKEVWPTDNFPIVFHLAGHPEVAPWILKSVPDSIRQKVHAYPGSNVTAMEKELGEEEIENLVGEE